MPRDLFDWNSPEASQYARPNKAARTFLNSMDLNQPRGGRRRAAMYSVVAPSWVHVGGDVDTAGMTSMLFSRLLLSCSIAEEPDSCCRISGFVYFMAYDASLGVVLHKAASELTTPLSCIDDTENFCSMLLPHPTHQRGGRVDQITRKSCPPPVCCSFYEFGFFGRLQRPTSAETSFFLKTWRGKGDRHIA